MTNQEYLKANSNAFQVFISNNIDEFRKNHDYLIDSLKYYAHCFGAGIQKDGTENDIVKSSYSSILVKGLLGTSLGIPIDAKTWNGWIIERIG
jgi:hypothetical protein